MVAVVAGNRSSTTCAMMRARGPVLDAPSNREAKSAMLMSSSKPGGIIVVAGDLQNSAGRGGTCRLQKRRASSNLSGTLTDGWRRVNTIRRPQRILDFG